MDNPPMSQSDAVATACRRRAWSKGFQIPSPVHRRTDRLFGVVRLRLGCWTHKTPFIFRNRSSLALRAIAFLRDPLSGCFQDFGTAGIHDPGIDIAAIEVVLR